MKVNFITPTFREIISDVRYRIEIIVAIIAGGPVLLEPVALTVVNGVVVVGPINPISSIARLFRYVSR